MDEWKIVEHIEFRASEEDENGWANALWYEDGILSISEGPEVASIKLPDNVKIVIKEPRVIITAR